MSKFNATVSQVAAPVVTLTAVHAALNALNGVEAFKVSGCGYTDAYVCKMTSDIVCGYAAECSVDGQKVVRVGITRKVIPFGVIVTLRNGQGHGIEVINTSFGCKLVERNAQGWRRIVSSSEDVLEMLTVFTGAVKA